MQLHGSVRQNLASAIQSARRLKRHPIHADTIDHWIKLLAQGRAELAAGSMEPIQDLIVELENELADRTL